MRQQGGVVGHGGVKGGSHGSGGAQSVQVTAQDVLNCLNLDNMGQGTLRQLLGSLPGGVLDFSQQEAALNAQALCRLRCALDPALNGGAPVTLECLDLGPVEDFDALCAHLPHLPLPTLKLSGLRIACERGHRLLSIREMSRLQDLVGSGRLPIKTLIVDRQGMLSAQQAAWESLSAPRPSAGVQIGFVEAVPAVEREPMVRRAWLDLLRGGFSPPEVDALLASPEFKDFHELDLADMVVDGVRWRGLPMVLASPASPVRTLVLPPPSDPGVARCFGLARRYDTVRLYFQLIFGERGHEERSRVRLDTLHLRGWTADELNELGPGFRKEYPVERCLVSGTPEKDFEELLRHRCLGSRLRVQDWQRFSEPQLALYRWAWWDELLNQDTALDLGTLLNRAEFSGGCLDHRIKLGGGYCATSAWLRLAEVLKHPACHLHTVVFSETDVSTPADRERFLSAFVHRGRPLKLDLSRWSAWDGCTLVGTGRPKTAFGPDDAKCLASLQLPQPVPVIVLAQQQILALQSSLEALVRQGWVFEDPQGQRVIAPPIAVAQGGSPTSPHEAPLDKGRWSRALETNDEWMIRECLKDAAPAQVQAIKAFARVLSGLDAENPGQAMPAAQFDGVMHLVGAALRNDNDAVLSGALMRDGRYKGLSLAQCRALVQGPADLSEEDRLKRERVLWAFGHTSRQHEERRARQRQAFFFTWNEVDLKASLADDPGLSPSERVALNDRARFLAEQGRRLNRWLDGQETDRI